jgi:hypothetical protein
MLTFCAMVVFGLMGCVGVVVFVCGWFVGGVLLFYFLFYFK